MKTALATMILLAPATVWAGDIAISDAYARFMPGGMSGAAFLVIENHGDTDDRLLGVASDAAAEVSLHSHTMTAEGIMQMGEIAGGIALPAGQSHALARGGDHVMFMGLTGPVGDRVTLVLDFQHAEDMTIEIPVDNQR